VLAITSKIVAICEGAAVLRAAAGRVEEDQVAVGVALDGRTHLFDTAGRSPQNRRQITDLKAFLEAAKPSETHLCVSATTKNADLLPIVGKFGLVPVNRFLVTKLDETRSHGLLLNLAANFQVPISYLTTGQNVPNDIEVASPERMAELVLGESRG
jgi:flagellar biosynthesis protein FlhF